MRTNTLDAAASTFAVLAVSSCFSVAPGSDGPPARTSHCVKRKPWRQAQNSLLAHFFLALWNVLLL